MNKKILSFILLVLAICFNISIATAQSNTLNEKEKKEGWQLLFNGKDLQGWHSYLQPKAGKAWQVEDGAIMLNKNEKSVYEDYADLTSDEEYENFDFKV